MAKTETVLAVFVASPSDATEERAALKQVIDELNITWANSLGIRLDLIRWETHGYPGISDDAQAVINEELPDDYDIFIGIAWTRLGTQTHRTESGTVEEFERAYSRFSENPEQLRIMFYFKTTPVSPLELDAENIARVKGFRDRLGDQGALYWTFSDLDDFKNLVRVHLSRQVQSWGKAWGCKDEKRIEQTKAVADAERQIHDYKIFEEEEEEGFLDLVEIGTTNFQTAGEVLTRITEATNQWC